MRLLTTIALALTATAAVVTADDANLCRVTGNYGCTQKGWNCNDVIGDEGVPVFRSKFLSCFDYKSSEDGVVCCNPDGLNGGYCPNRDELEGYGFYIQKQGSPGSYGGDNFIMPKGEAKVKCNQRGGPHYCFGRTIRTPEGTLLCTDPGQY